MSGIEPMADPVPVGAIVVGVDGSETADRAVEWAARYADREKRPLVIAYALGVGVTPEAATLYFHGGAAFGLVYEQMQAAGEGLVAATAGKVAESYPSVEVITVVEHVDPRQLLFRLAKDASLVVMGSRGRGQFRSLLLGSVTSGVAGRVDCPVVVIPAKDDAEGEPASRSSS